MSLNEATKRNLRRKSAYVDHVQMYRGLPLFSWVDISLTELCNRSAGHPRACSFCPRIDPRFYPNQNLHMTLSLARKIADELKAISYEGVVVFCGYGEPMLHPSLPQIVEMFDCRVEIVTNGDFLNSRKIADLRHAGVDYFVVSMYDGPHQEPLLHKAFSDAGVASNEDVYLLRDRWHSEADQFGLKLTNRAGTVTVGPQDEVDTRKPCYYLSYQLQIDWNGDVLLCPQDWHKRLKFGNISTESLVDVWTSKRMHKRRMQLIRGARVEHPCSSCNTDGTLHGFNHVPLWVDELKKVG